MKSPFVFVACLLGSLLVAIPSYGGSNPCAGAKDSCNTWRKIFDENKLQIPFPEGWDPDQAVTSGALTVTANSVILAYFPYHPKTWKQVTFFWCYNFSSKKWITSKIEGELVGHSIGDVRSLKNGYLIDYFSKNIATYRVLNSELTPMCDFEGIYADELPDGSIYSQSWGQFGNPCVLSLLRMNPPKQACILDWNDTKFKDDTPDIEDHVVYSPRLGIFGAKIRVYQKVKSFYGPDEATPVKSKLLALAFQCENGDCQKLYVLIPDEVKAGDMGLVKFMRTEALSKFMKANGKIIKENPDTDEYTEPLILGLRH